MDHLEADDYYSLADEKFDFDMSLSPASSRGDEEEDLEDEVFCSGPGVRTKPSLSVSGGEETSWRPLLGESFESIRKEAHLLANRLQDSRQEEVGGGETSLRSGRDSNRDPPVELFVQDPQDKLGLLSLPCPSTALSPIKRETFCVQDSPLKLLPTALQPRPPPPATAATRLRTRPGTSSPAGPKTRTQTQMSLRGKTGLGVLPNKPPPPSTRRSTQHSGPAARPAPPGKGALRLQRGSSRGSCEDLLSDTASVASNASDCSLNSFNSSLSISPTGQGKVNNSLVNPPVSGSTRRSMLYGKAEPPAVPPTTPTPGAQRPLSTRLRRPSEVGRRPPSVGRSTPVKRAGPSTPLALTPAKRLRETAPSSKPSLASSSKLSLAASSKPSLASSSSKPSLASSSSKPNLASSKPSLASSSKPNLASSSSKPSLASSSSKPNLASSKPSLASSSKPSLASSSSKPSLASSSSKPNLASSKPSLASSSKPNLASSSKPSLASPSKPQQHPGSRANARAPVIPTPTHLRCLAGPEVVSTPDTPCIIKPKRQVSTCSVDSLPQRAPAVELLATPSSSSPSALQWRPRRSALPTPSGRRLSSIPTMTPRGLSHTRQGTPSRPPAGGVPAQVEEEQCFSVVLQPFSLEEEEDPAPSVSVGPRLDGPQGPLSPPPTTQGPGEPDQENQEEKENQRDLIELLSAEDTPTALHSKHQNIMEVLLVDVPAPLLRLDEKLLIDLSNTPDLVRTHAPKPCGGELIDLSSPLIKWSPEEKKEKNTGVLINLSF